MTGLYLGLVAHVFAAVPVTTIILSLDTHIFLRLVTSFEPILLTINWWSWSFMLSLHLVSSVEYNKNGVWKALSDFGVVEWTYVILWTWLSFGGGLVVTCGFQDAYPEFIFTTYGLAEGRKKASLMATGGALIGLTVVPLLMNFKIPYLDLNWNHSHTMFDGYAFSFSTNSAWNSCNTTLLLFQLKFLWGIKKNPDSYIVWKAAIQPAKNELCHHTHTLSSILMRQPGA